MLAWCQQGECIDAYTGNEGLTDKGSQIKYTLCSLFNPVNVALTKMWFMAFSKNLSETKFIKAKLYKADG